jgi:hypothetical protein
MVNLQELSDHELEQLQKQFRRMSEHYSQRSDHVDEVIEIAEVMEEKKEVEGKE